MVDPLSRINDSLRIVVLHGNEPFLLTAGMERLAECLAARHGAIARVSFDGADAELADVLDELRSFALFEPHKLVVVDNAEAFLAVDGRRPPMEAYAARPAEGATLLMRSSAWRPGRFDKAVAGVGAVIRCQERSDRDAIAWCVAECPRRHGREIDRDAAGLLVQRLGPGLGRLDTEMGKLAAFVGGAPRIRLDDARALVGHTRQEKAWALQEEILTGSPGRACARIRELREISDVDNVLVAWAICDLLRRLHAASRLLRGGASAGAIRSELRLFGPAADGIIESGRRIAPPALAQLLRLAVTTDHRCKSGWGDPDRNLEALAVVVTDTIRCG